MPKTKIKNEQNKKLTLGHIKEADTQYNKMVKVEFDDGRYTMIFSKFRPSKRQELLNDFSKFLIEYEKAGNQIKEKDVMNYLNLHIIQHFSDIFSEAPSDIHEKLDIYGKLLDSKYGEKIMESFDKKEIEKIYEDMYKIMEQQMELISKNKELQKQLKEKVASMDLEHKDTILKIMFAE